MSNNQPASGVTGNTQPQLNAAAGPSATATRAANWQKHKKTLALIAIAIAVITAIIVFTSKNVQTGGLLLTGLIIWYVGRQFKKKPSMSWGSIVEIAGAAMIAIVGISTSFVQKPLEGINTLEESIASVDLNCSGPVTITQTSRPMPAMRAGCTQEFIIELSGPLQILAMDSRLDGDSSKYFQMRRPSADLLEVTPNELFPKDGPPVKVTILTDKEAAKYEAELASKDAALIEAALAGAS